MKSSPHSPRHAAYRAPWCRPLKLISIGVSALCLGLFISQLVSPTKHALWPHILWIWSLLPIFVAGAAPFIVRSYALDGETLLIERLFWTTRIALDGLLSATVEPRAMRACVRTCGNGGVFSFTGWFWSRPLGHFRAFVTDLNRTVVLRFADRTLVLSPDEPEEFVRDISHHSSRRYLA